MNAICSPKLADEYHKCPVEDVYLFSCGKSTPNLCTQLYIVTVYKSENRFWRLGPNIVENVGWVYAWLNS